jgi:hypothetical protein
MLATRGALHKNKVNIYHVAVVTKYGLLKLYILSSSFPLHDYRAYIATVSLAFPRYRYKNRKWLGQQVESESACCHFSASCTAKCTFQYPCHARRRWGRQRWRQRGICCHPRKVG